MNYTLILSICSLLLAAYTFLSNKNKENTSELTTVIVKLESIGNGIRDIKAEIAELKNNQKDDHDKLIRLESSLTTAWKRIDEFKIHGSCEHCEQHTDI